MTYRRAIATALAALVLLTGCHQPARYAERCAAPTEDSKVTCKLNPTARYDYDAGWWHLTDRASAPTGAEVMAFDPDA